MCWISQGISKDIPISHIKQAYRAKNKHGFGIMWHNGTTAESFKTFHYKSFRKKMKELSDFNVIIHLRYATKGSVDSLDNCHPFPVSNGFMMHNGTLNNFGSSMTCTTNTCSDSNEFAEILSRCSYTSISDILPLVTHLATDRINRLIFLENDGTITIVNKHLGIQDGDIWYSNDYHILPELTENLVFVYGTLKMGYHNHAKWMKGAKFIGDATSIAKWAMVNTNNSYPYLLGRNPYGHNIIGEVYSVTDDQLSSLDILEGFPHHYTNQYITVKITSTGEIMSPLVYVKAHVSSYDLSHPFIAEF